MKLTAQWKPLPRTSQLAAICFFDFAFAGATAQRANPTFQPTWVSIRTQKVPEWFDDAKFE